MLDGEHAAFMGGLDANAKGSNAVTMVNIRTNVTKKLTPMNRPKWNCTSILAQGQVLVFGGYKGGFVKDLESIDSFSFSRFGPRRRFRLDRKHQMPRALDRATIVSSNGYVYVVGGYGDGLALNTVFEYNMDRKTWRQMPSMNEARHGAMAAIASGLLVVLGGVNNDDEYLSSVETFPILGWSNTSSWSLAGEPHSLPEGRAFAFAFVVREREVVVAGGEGNGGKWLESFSHHHNIDVIAKPMSAASSSEGFVNSPFPPFPGRSGFSLMSMTVAASCLVYVDHDGAIHTLDFESISPHLDYRSSHEASPQQERLAQEYDAIVSDIETRENHSTDVLSALADVDAIQLSRGLEIISQHSEDLRRMIHESLQDRDDELEVEAIFVKPRLRNFYVTMLQFLKAAVKAIETLASGLIEGSSETRNTFLRMLQSRNSKLRQLILSPQAVKETIEYFPFPYSKLVGSAVGFLLSLKGSREGAMAAARVSAFCALCDTMSCGADKVLERIARLTVRLSHHRGLIPEMDERFKWGKRQILRLAGANDRDTPIKESGAIAAQQVVEYISNPSAVNKSSELNKLYKGYAPVVSQIADMVVTETFGLSLDEVGRLRVIEGGPCPDSGTTSQPMTAEHPLYNEFPQLFGTFLPRRTNTAMTFPEGPGGDRWQHKEVAACRTREAEHSPIDAEEGHYIQLAELRQTTQELKSDLDDAKHQAFSALRRIKVVEVALQKLRQNKKMKFSSGGGGLICAYKDRSPPPELSDRVERVEVAQAQTFHRLELVERETASLAEDAVSFAFHGSHVNADLETLAASREKKEEAKEEEMKKGKLRLFKRLGRSREP